MDLKSLIGIKKKRGRPRKNPIEEVPTVSTDEPKMEVGRNFRLDRSPFDLDRFGLTADPNKDYRWLDPRRIDERKHNDGYELVTNADSPHADRTIRTRGNMVLAQRPRTLADERKLEKEVRTARQLSTTKEDFDNRMERLSSKYGMDLHKLLKK